MLFDEIKSGLKDAMKAKDTARLAVIRDLMTSFTSELTSKGLTPRDVLEDADVVTVIKRKVKQRKESITQFTAAGRDDLVAVEVAELAVLEPMLPETMSIAEIKDIASAKISEMGDVDKAQAGRIIGALMGELKGKADGADVKTAVEELLS